MLSGASLKPFPINPYDCHYGHNYKGEKEADLDPKLHKYVAAPWFEAGHLLQHLLNCCPVQQPSVAKRILVGKMLIFSPLFSVVT